MSTLGPGATNFTTAAAYAQLGGMPMMMITDDQPKARGSRVCDEEVLVMVCSTA